MNPLVFAELDKAWGPHTVDHFASFQNCQVSRFNSRCWNLVSEAVDAFTVDWSVENNRHGQVCRAKGTLQVIPLWSSAPFWPILCPYGTGHFSCFVKEARELPRTDMLIVSGPSGASLFNGKFPNTQVLALLCNFGDSD